MAADSWLKDELAELDETEKFIQQTMMEFVPSGGTLSGELTVILQELTVTLKN